jgi:hypothetical protein
MEPNTTLWQFCAGQDRWSGGGRPVCSRVLNFICERDYREVWLADADRREIDCAFRSNEGVLFRWSVSSAQVDFIGQKLWVNDRLLLAFLESRRFDVNTTYNPNRYQREAWYRSIRTLSAGGSPSAAEPPLAAAEEASPPPGLSLMDGAGRRYVLSDTGVKVFPDYRDNLIIDRDDPAAAEQAAHWKYTRGLVKGLSYLGSENSEDALTWNVFRTLMQLPNRLWLAAVLAPIPFSEDECRWATFHFWRQFPAPPARTVPEGPTHVDLTIETPVKLIFVEAKYRSGLSAGTTHDSERDQVIRNVDVGSWAARQAGKEFHFVLLNSEADRASLETLLGYKEAPYRIRHSIGGYRADLTIDDFGSLAERLHAIHWEQILGWLQGESPLEARGPAVERLVSYLNGKFPVGV